MIFLLLLHHICTYFFVHKRKVSTFVFSFLSMLSRIFVAIKPTFTGGRLTPIFMNTVQNRMFLQPILLNSARAFADKVTPTFSFVPSCVSLFFLLLFVYIFVFCCCYLDPILLHISSLLSIIHIQ